jgi:hypothetical protein
MDANTVVASGSQQLYVISVTDVRRVGSVVLVKDSGEVERAQVIPRLR